MSNGRGRLLAVRHGETEWSRSGRHTGRTDLALLPEGEAMAGRLAIRLGEQQFALVLTSPLQRARRTCELAGFGARAVIDDDLMEWDYGEVEGRTTAAVRAERPGWELWRDGCPGGETLEQVAARVDRVIARIRAVEGDVVVFAHAHLLRILAARWIGATADLGRAFALAPASVSTLAWTRETPIVDRWNDTSHLTDCSHLTD